MYELQHSHGQSIVCTACKVELFCFVFFFSFLLISVTNSQWLRIKDLYRFYPRATTFLSEYYAEDVGVVRFSNYSTLGWEHSPVFTAALISNLQIGSYFEF